jgi:glutamate carboxypeptidase
MTLRDPSVRLKSLRFVDEHVEEQFQFLLSLIRQNSYSWNKPGTDSVAEMILGRVRSAFPVHRVVEQTEVGNLHLLSNVHPGEQSIYMLAHMDTVFPPDHPFQDCWVDGNKLHGPGAGDMKAGIATLVYAVLALRDARVLDRIPLTVILAGDEEVGGPTSHSTYEEERNKAAACLVVETAGVNGEIVISRYGKIGARLESAGRNQHVGTAGPVKASAILELAHKTIGIEALNGALPDTRLNVGTVRGGLGPATVPGSAVAQADIRWKDQGHRDVLLKKIREVVARDDVPGCHTELRVLNERPAWPCTEGTQWLADLVKEAGAEVGQEIVYQHRVASGDANFFAAAGVPTVDGLGPVCQEYHTPEEFVYITSIHERTALLANSLLRVAHELTGE